MAGRGAPQQSVFAARRSDTGEQLLAEELLRMDELTFSALRREATEARLARRRGEDVAPLFVCSYCGSPLTLARLAYVEGGQNRFFKHDVMTDCPWSTPDRFSDAQMQRLEYEARRETAEHQDGKRFIAACLKGDPETQAGSVHISEPQRGAILCSERRIPDVAARWRGHAVVFEQQMNATYLTEVVARDRFYRTEQQHVIWIFSKYEPKFAVALDEANYNRLNLFVLDEEARAASLEAGRLLLNCYYQVPVVDWRTGRLVQVVHSQLVSLADLRFGAPGDRPYFFDYDAAHAAFDGSSPPPLVVRPYGGGAPAVAKRKREARDPYAEFAIAWITAGGADGDELEGELLHAAIAIPIREYRDIALEIGKEPYRTALNRIFMIAGITSLDSEFDNVIALIDSSMHADASSQRAFCELFVEVWAVYHPQMSDDDEARLAELGGELAATIARGDLRYRCHPGFSRLVQRLLPQMQLDHTVTATPPPPAVLVMPTLEWVPRAEVDQKRVAQKGTLYLSTHPETDWRAVLRRIYELRSASAATDAALADVARESQCRIGDLRNFLLAAGIVRKPL